MAEIAKSGVPSLSTVKPNGGERIAGNLLAGENIAAGDACYISSVDGNVYRSNGAAANDAAQVHGFCVSAAMTGDAISLYHGVNLQYGSGLTPGKRYYLSAAVLGGLADAPTTGGTGPVAFSIDTTRIRVKQSGY